MAEVAGIVTGFRAKVLGQILHHHERPGSGQVNAFAKAIDHLETLTMRKLQDVNLRTGESITEAQALVGALADEVTDAATSAEAVELPEFGYGGE